MKYLFLLSLFSGIFIAQKPLTGPDAHLNARAELICQRIADSEIPIEDMYSRQASMLTIKKGLEPANERIRHMRKLKEQGIDDFFYEGYINLYLSQACADYNRLLAVFNTQHLGNKLKRARFIELHNFMTDFMQAESVTDIQRYVNPTQWDSVLLELQPHLEKLQKVRWTASVMVIPEWREVDKYTIQVIDIHDTDHFFELEISYIADKDSKISEVSLNEYTKAQPKPYDIEYIEEEEVMPIRE